MNEEKKEGTPQIPGLKLRYTLSEDREALKEWLMQPNVLTAFPMGNEQEVDDSVKHWMTFARFKSSLTADYEDKPVGMATLCLMPYKKIAHQCLLSIIVSEEMRGKGVGTILMNNILHLAKATFKLEVIYLEVYEGNPAISLYRRFGFKEVGTQRHFMKEEGKYVGKIVMERLL